MFAKLEMANPTGSVKDRAAKYLIEDLEARRPARADSVILEPTSGNTGIALAMIGRRKGYRVALVMPDNVTRGAAPDGRRSSAPRSSSRRGSSGSNGAIALAREMAAGDPRYVMPYQYGNPANPQAHYETTGPEILADCPEIDAFVAGLGTVGHADGRRAATCASTSRASGSTPPSRCPGENVQGLRSLDEGFVPEIFDPTLLDGKFLVSNRDAVAALRDLVAKEGIFAGPSSGAVLVAAARVARRWSTERSWRCCPTAAGSTCRPGRTSATSTRWRTTSRAASTGGEHAAVAVRPGSSRDSSSTRGTRYPNEACGLIIGTAPAAEGGRALRFEPTRNAAASPYRYEINSKDLLRLTLATDDADEVFWAIVHSHTHTPARPSPTDIGLAFYPDALYVLVSLAEDEPDIRAWRIVEGSMSEVPLEVTE